MKRILTTAAMLLCMHAAQAQMGEAETKAMMEYGTPGPMHKMLAEDNGNWKAEVSIWMMPGGEPTTYTVKVKNEMIMNGLFQQSTMAGEMMGMPFTGMSTTGYDNARKVFVNTWVDNFSSGIMTSEGKWDAKTRSIEFKGMTTDPMSKKQMPFRQVLTWVDANHQTLEMYMTADGKEFKSLAVKYSR